MNISYNIILIFLYLFSNFGTAGLQMFQIYFAYTTNQFQALDYNLMDAKKKRMLIVMETCKQLKGNDQLTPEFIRLACLLGWSVELVIFFFW